jgi:GlpG protein
MRRIGTVENASYATRFCDFLLTQGIDSSFESVAEASSSPPDFSRQDIWVKDEQKVDKAKAALSEFLQAPNNPRYAVSNEAAKRRAQEEAENKRRLRNQQKVQHRQLPGMGSTERPLVVLVTIAICILLGLATDFGNPRLAFTPRGELIPSSSVKVFNALKFLSYEDAQRSENPFASILKGEVWRLITPALLHGGIGHLAMNMIGLFLLGGAIERLQGRRFIAFLLFATAIAGTVVQALWPESQGGGANAVGASGATYGLFGYLWLRPFYDADFSIRVPPTFLFLGIAFLLLGIANVIDGIANGAHVGGLAAGMLIATLASSPGRDRSKGGRS